jgi:glycosyltransferase involved in cell wall biosynthesis
MRLRAPKPVSDELAYWAKIQLDIFARKVLKHSDVFLFYNGCGLDSARWFQKNGGISIVEAVNSHVLVQEKLLQEEHKRLGLPCRSFHWRETRRRVAEVEEADFVLVPSTFVARSFRDQGVPEKRLLKVPYPMQRISGASNPTRAGVNNEIFRVLFVGTISVRKGVGYLIEAFRQLKRPRKELWIVGPATRPSGLDNVHIPEGIRFLGPLKGNELQQAYLNSTVFCLPSIEEGLALVLSEALALGLPVIATTNTGVEDLPSGGGGALVVPIRDASAIAACLQKLADDPEFLAEKKRAAVEWADMQARNARPISTLAETLFGAFTKRAAS